MRDATLIQTRRRVQEFLATTLFYRDFILDSNN